MNMTVKKTSDPDVMIVEVGGRQDVVNRHKNPTLFLAIVIGILEQEPPMNMPDHATVGEEYWTKATKGLVKVKVLRIDSKDHILVEEQLRHTRLFLRLDQLRTT